MKLAFIHPFLFRYARGIERYTVNLSSALARQSTRVEILTWQWNDAVHWEELDPRVRVVTFPTPRFYTATWMAPLYFFHFLRHAYDRVFIHFADYGESGALNALRRLGRRQPFSIVLHYPRSQVPHRYDSFQKRGLHSQADEIIAVSRFVAGEAQAFFQRECQVIGHGVDSQRFKPDPQARSLLRQELGIQENAPLLLTASALEARKGIAAVLQSLPVVTAQFPDLVYLVLGDGSQKQKLVELIRQLHLERHVRLLPATTQIERYYQAADLFLILAKGEASSLVSLEAMACELPVIASKHPPFDELIQPSWGRQVDETDPQGISGIITSLLADAASRRQMGEAGRAQILTRYTWQQVSQKYWELLHG